MLTKIRCLFTAFFSVNKFNKCVFKSGDNMLFTQFVIHKTNKKINCKIQKSNFLFT